MTKYSRLPHTQMQKFNKYYYSIQLTKSKGELRGNLTQGIRGVFYKIIGDAQYCRVTYYAVPKGFALIGYRITGNSSSIGAVFFLVYVKIGVYRKATVGNDLDLI